MSETIDRSVQDAIADYARAMREKRITDAVAGLDEALAIHARTGEAVPRSIHYDLGRHLYDLGRIIEAETRLREGLARYFELLRVSGESAAVFPSPRLEAQVRALKDAGTLIPTARLVGLSDEDWRSENQADQRLDAQSWSLVYFLLSTPDGGVLLGEILAQAQASDGALSVSAAVLAARLPGGLGGLESGWRTWLGSRPSAHHY